MEPQTPIQIHIPPSLHHLAIPLPTFLSQNKQYTNLAVGSFIFTSSTTSRASAPRLLIVQRAASERGFPTRWEVPGGGCEVSDPTILHSLARETFEETGLRLTRFRRQVGSGEEFVTGYGAREKRWCKLSFEIEVAEIEGDDMSCGRSGGQERVAAKADVGPKGVDAVDGVLEAEGVNGASITLDPAEHQAYAWVTEKEIREDKYAIISSEQKHLVREALTLRQVDVEKSKAMLAGATSAVPPKQGSSE
ncbi:MAG: hypothetical protein ASARMPREDX12_000209 [Alectoria sarmentosa]|nr:MAG: hypothetical protein ASARMPREDX12_000209 [Alectoria sarmentosa]